MAMGVARRISVGIERGGQVQIEVDGEPIVAHEGETIAAALLAAGRHAFRYTKKQEAPRALFCGMGVCFDCAMTVNGIPNVRACVTLVEPGMKVQTQRESQW